MGLTLTSLLAITIVGFIAPVISFVVPHRVIPETVLLLVGGMIIGPYGINLATITDPLHLISELGIALLFLLAGYEIDPQIVSGKTGKGALVAWVVSISFGFLAVMTYAGVEHAKTFEGITIAIAVSATALGTLLPILKDRNLLETPLGKAVMAHGAMGEIGPIIMMALLLSFGNTWTSILLLGAFGAVAVVLAIIPTRAQAAGARLVKIVRFGSHTTAQTTVRLVVALLVLLISFAASLGLDIVLGAFAAGFIVRQALPEGRREIEEKLDGLAFGFFIPTFFVISGTSIDFRVLFQEPTSLLVFLGILLAARGLPVFLTLCSSRLSPDQTLLPLRQRAMASLYCTTNLPIIVAVTQLAVNAKAISPHYASILVTAGTLSVLLMPMLAYATEHLPGREQYRKWRNRGLLGQPKAEVQQASAPKKRRKVIRVRKK